MTFDHTKLTDGPCNILTTLSNEEDTKIASTMWSQFCFNNKHERFVCRAEESHDINIKSNSLRRAKKIDKNALMCQN